MTAGRQLVAKLLLLIASLGFCVGSAEVGLRLIGRDNARVWVPDPEVGWILLPGARRHWTDEGDGLIQVNSLGHRDRERRLTPDPAVTRIAVFGDSTTEADQVNLGDTYVARLEADLQRSGYTTESLNLGVTGYSPIQELLLMRREAARYRPQVVVLGLFLDNDVSGCHPALSVAPEAPFATVDGDRLRFDYSRAVASFDDYHREPLYTVRRYSAIYRVLTELRHRQTAMSSAGASPRAQTVPKRFEIYGPAPRAEWEQAWRTLEGVLASVADDTRRLGAKLVVLSIPAAQVVDPRAWAGLLDQNPSMRARSWDLEGPERRLRTIADAHQIALLQPYREFQSAASTAPSGSLYFGNVGHMTARGHELLAAELAKFLKERKLLERATLRAATR